MATQNTPMASPPKRCMVPNPAYQPVIELPSVLVCSSLSSFSLELPDQAAMR